MGEDWPDFTTRLERVLSALTTGESEVVLIISDRTEPACYVQYSGGEGALWAEVAGNKYRPKLRRLSKDDEKSLRAAGWKKPGRLAGPGLPNWWLSIVDGPSAVSRLFRSAPPPPPDYRRLAEMTVMALRDVMRVGTPLGLRYRAFVHETGEPLALDDLGLQPE